MGSAMAALVAVLGFAMLVAGAQSLGFNDQFLFYPNDGYHVQASPDGQSANLVLTQASDVPQYADFISVGMVASASGFWSVNKYLFGHLQVRIKFVPGNSAGTVTAYYLSSTDSSHDELDFEILGNSTNQPYLVQTNVFANGIGGREQRIALWFDPTLDFHTYGFFWNKDIIIFEIDGKPIRVFKNSEDLGVAYPKMKAMGMYASLWDGSDWATEGGRVKLDWVAAPFICSFQDFTNLDGCVCNTGDVAACSSGKWWDAPQYQSLSPIQQQGLADVKANYLTYDYCTDSVRYPTTPAECSRN